LTFDDPAQIARPDIGPIVGIIFFGGIVGPELMLLGLRSLSALTGSLPLHLEARFTALLAVGFMHEHLSRREAFASATII
jgi:drug/metabolite transporter (DMT)-like permease